MRLRRRPRLLTYYLPMRWYATWVALGMHLAYIRFLKWVKMGNQPQNGPFVEFFGVLQGLCASPTPCSSSNVTK